ncbi:right-handed parallel beta-helix repeat-containing protein [Candidatus Shapirobacteria bacterium]|nr:right-handed parallel beta-helix repeat-containing protein [Candidatus Shapirobacteria bacterium]
MKIWFWLLVFFIIGGRSVWATEYFVATNGSDSNTGTSNNLPLLKIQTAINKARAGDTVYVHGGTYKEGVGFSGSGTNTARIVVLAVANENPIIDGSGVSVKNDGLVQFMDNANYITFSGFTVKNSPTQGIANRGSNNIISNNKILLSQNTAIWHRFGTNTVFRNNEVFFNIRMNATLASDAGVTCNTSASWWDAAMNSQNSSGVLWEGNYVHDNCGEGIVAHTGDKVIGNKFKDNWSVNIYVDNGTGIIIDKNFMYETETAPIPISSGYGYKKIASGVTIADENSPCNTSDNTISNNIIVNTRYGFGFYQYNSCSGIKATKIVNNTFINSWDYGIRIVGSSAVNSGSVIANNIVYSTRGKAMILENPADFKVQNNLWYFAGGDSTGQFQWGATERDFTAWSGTSPSQILGNIWADPQFLNSLSTIVDSIAKVKTTSPAIDGGSQLVVTNDYGGASRPQGLRVDIGAFEFGGSASPAVIVGNFNGDSVVDMLDFVFWKKEYLAGRMTLLDFGIWKKAYLGV